MARKQNRKVLGNYPNKYYLFICEDEKSMRYYWDGIKPYLRSNVKIETRHSNNGNTAKQVYECAKSYYDNAIKNKEAYPKGFTVVACFDKDQNESNQIASIMSKTPKAKKYDGVCGTLEVVYNNPCYEYWLYLHIKNDAPDFASSEDCEKRTFNLLKSKYGVKIPCLKELKRYTSIFEVVKSDVKTAISNANALNFEDYNKTYTNTQKILSEIIDFDKIG